MNRRSDVMSANMVNLIFYLGFILASDGSCQINSNNNGSCCQQKSLTSSACLSCSQGLFLSNGKCV
jgi:hypothetical protein